jgi:hypothetical protein
MSAVVLVVKDRQVAAQGVGRSGETQMELKDRRGKRTWGQLVACMVH